MRAPLEGLDPTAEAETDPADAGPSEAIDQGAMRRALRDLEQAKARVQRDAEQAAQELREKLVLELLPVLDNLDRTVRAAELSGEAESVLEGVRLVRSQFAQVLQRYGVERIDARHHAFDPAMHEAIGTLPVASAAAHNMVLDQIEPGYRFGTRLLRPARVVVGRMPRFH